MYITNPQKTNAVYYLIGFKPPKPVIKKGTSDDHFEAPAPAPPLFIDWKDVEFKPAANGGRRNIMQQKTSALKELEIHVTTLKEGCQAMLHILIPMRKLFLFAKDL